MSTENSVPERASGNKDAPAKPVDKFVVAKACVLLGLAPLISFLGAAIGTLLSVKIVTAYVIAEFITAGIFVLFGIMIGRRAGILGTGADAFGLMTGVAAAVCFYPTAMLVSEFTGKLFPTEPLEESFSMVTTNLAPWLVWVILALLPSISEELLCRGVLFGAFRRYGAVPAILVSAAVFACMHGSLQQGAYTFLLGIIWACLRECTGSIAPGIISHLAFNTAGVLIMLEPRMSGGGPLPDGGFLYSYTALGLLGLLGAAGGIAVMLTARKRYNPVPVTGDIKIGAWPLMGACIACFTSIAFNLLLSMV